MFPKYTGSGRRLLRHGQHKLDSFIADPGSKLQLVSFVVAFILQWLTCIQVLPP